MKLLFDHNLPPHLVERLADIFPASNHVYRLGLDQAQDRVIRIYARQHGFTMVTKDSDFCDLCLLSGFPPKVIWLRRGNCKTTEVEQLLRSRHTEIEAFAADLIIGVLTLY